MKHAISPHELATALADAPAGIEMLSLDCFDTLIWRNVHAPRDVFADLGDLGVSKQQRIWAERHARSRARLRHGRNETGIADIHAALLPNGDAAERARSVEAELDAEARHCFAFLPTAELIAEAKRRGLAVAIVSDTYLSRTELTRLIARVAGEELVAQIDFVFCSSEYGLAKAEGLFKHVLRESGVRPERILHIGDNEVADFEAARAAGLNAIHLRQFDDASHQRLRLEAAAGAIVNGSGSGEVPACQSHRAAISLTLPTIDQPAEAMGYATLGPVFHAFSRWLADEAAELNKLGGRTHLLFLMRDGHLPKCVFDRMAASPALPCHAVEISRFTATAASFSDAEAVLSYLEAEVGTGDFDAIARQLLFLQHEKAKLLRHLPKRDAARAFVAAVRTPATIRKIIERSDAYAKRLAAHVQRVAAPAPGDTLVLVDLGYNGTVQDRAEPVLRRELGVRVAGRYLLLREQKLTGLDKKGLLDARHYDPGTLDAFCANVAVLEQLSTLAQGSVVDYDGEGAPIRSGNSIKARQSAVRERVQQGCIRFAAERDRAFVRTPASDNPDSLRQTAAATLGRLLFLPMPDELQVLDAFEHDVNLGTEGTVALFDAQVAEEGLKRRGLFYLKGAERMYLPAELRGHGLPLSLAMLTQRRFGLDLRFGDFCDSGVDLPVIIADGTDLALQSVQATPTHDGYFLAAIPIGDCRYAIGVQFGRLYEWVQVESAQFLPVADFLNDNSALRPAPVNALPSLEGMEQVAPHLMRCHDETAFMMVPPPMRADATPMMLTVVFRPIAARIVAPVSADQAAVAVGAIS